MATKAGSPCAATALGQLGVSDLPDGSRQPRSATLSGISPIARPLNPASSMLRGGQDADEVVGVVCTQPAISAFARHRRSTWADATRTAMHRNACVSNVCFDVPTASAHHDLPRKRTPIANGRKSEHGAQGQTERDAADSARDCPVKHRPTTLPRGQWTRRATRTHRTNKRKRIF